MVLRLEIIKNSSKYGFPSWFTRFPIISRQSTWRKSRWHWNENCCVNLYKLATSCRRLRSLDVVTIIAAKLNDAVGMIKDGPKVAQCSMTQPTGAGDFFCFCGNRTWIPGWAQIVAIVRCCPCRQCRRSCLCHRLRLRLSCRRRCSNEIHGLYFVTIRLPLATFCCCTRQLWLLQLLCT